VLFWTEKKRVKSKFLSYAGPRSNRWRNSKRHQIQTLNLTISFTIISQSLICLPRRLVFRSHKLRKNTHTHTHTHTHTQLNPKSEIPSAFVNLSHLYTMISSPDRHKCVRKTPNTERLHSKQRTRHHLAISHLSVPVPLGNTSKIVYKRYTERQPANIPCGTEPGTDKTHPESRFTRPEIVRSAATLAIARKTLLSLSLSRSLARFDSCFPKP